jgi:hypothetical protein
MGSARGAGLVIGGFHSHGRLKASTAISATPMARGQNTRAARRGQNPGTGRLPSPLRRQNSLAFSPSQARVATRSSPNRFQGGA